jgi:hypothetical protein
VTAEPRAFFAIDQGAATTSAGLIGRLAGQWRLLGSLALPAGVPVDAITEQLLTRLRIADPTIAADVGIATGRADSIARLVARSTPPRTLAVVAATERSLGSLVAAAERTGWRIRAASLERTDALAMSSMLLDTGVATILAGASEPAGADERTQLGELAALVAAAATRRPEVGIILAGAMHEQLPRFNSQGDAGGTRDVVLAPPASAGTPVGMPLRELLDGMRGGPDDTRTAFLEGTRSLAEALDRRIETIDLAFDAGQRVVAAPAGGDEPATTSWVTIADAALVPPDPDESIVDAVIGWSTIAIDRHRLRDRLQELRLGAWGDAAGAGAMLRLAAARAALTRLVEASPELDALPPADLLIVAGGAWAVAPGPAIALAVADVVRRPGACQIAWDHARLLAPLGAIDDRADRRAILADLADDLLAPLGSVVMPQGMRAGRSSGRLVVHGSAGSTELDLVPGGLELVDLPPGVSAVAEFRFRDAVRLGTRGRHFAVDVAGGLGGLLVDLRDVPLKLPDRVDRRRELLAGWQEALWARHE